MALHSITVGTPWGLVGGIISTALASSAALSAAAVYPRLRIDLNSCSTPSSDLAYCRDETAGLEAMFIFFGWWSPAFNLASQRSWWFHALNLASQHILSA